MNFKNNIIGIIPAGGFGTRIKPFKMWKELIPVGYRSHKINNNDVLIPKCIAEYTVYNMIEAGLKKMIFIINDQKIELIRYFGTGKEYKANFCYSLQNIESGFYGLPIALDTAYEWVKDSIVLMGLPDTIVRPDDCFRRLLDFHLIKNSDLTIGVFPTKNPTRLAPVEIDKQDNRVINIYDKPAFTTLYNTWNIAVWSPRFTELLHNSVKEFIRNKQSTENEIILTNVFLSAIQNDLNVYGYLFKDGCCHDLGTITDLAEKKHEIENEMYNENNENFEIAKENIYKIN